MKDCPRCKAQVADASLFCQFCGSAFSAADSTGPKSIQKETSLNELLETRSDGFFAKLGQEIKALRFGAVFPIKLWWKDKPWSLLWVKWFLFFGFFPLVLIHYYGGENIAIGSAAWALGIYFSLVWAFVFRICLLPEKIAKVQLAKVFLFTMVFCVLFVGMLLQWSPVQKLYAFTSDPSFWYRMLGFIVGVGIVEESVKALPVYFFIYRKKLDYKPSTYAFIGALSGLAFGASEAVVYSFVYASDHANQMISYGDYLVVQILRLVSLPLLHALWAGIAGYFIGLARANQKIPRALMVVGIGISVLLHGFYDLFAGNWLGVLIGTLSLIIFIAYVRTQDQISGQLNGEHPDRAPQKDVVLTPHLSASPTALESPSTEKSTLS